jgi:predicted RNA-binding Zn-ribbon protein involved in translation (DUF1610 family)
MVGPPPSVRLPFWSRPAPDERQHAIATLRSLGTTSIPGLAAALSWSVPRTEKVLKELSRHGPPGLVYDGRSGTIRWSPPTPTPARSAPPPLPTPSSNPSWSMSAARSASRPGTAPTPTASTAAPRPVSYRSTVTPPAPSPSPRVAPSDHALRECARCHTPLVPTGTVDEFACPMCGRRISAGGTLVSPSPGRTAGPAGPDPKVQQLIAAWATGQPAPCPHCRQPLRHTADGEFRCGSCGARISYGSPAGTTASPATGAPVVGPSR